MQKRKPYLTPNEAANLLMVSPITIRQWAAKGLLKAEVTVGGHRRFLVGEVERFARERGVALQRERRSGPLRVLIVDDDVQTVRFLQELLSEHRELALETAKDGFDAGNKVQTFEPDVLLIDLLMPGLDGFEVCRRLKAEPTTRHIRLIVVTGFPTAENQEKARQAGAELLLGKPLDTDLLQQILLNDASQVMASG